MISNTQAASPIKRNWDEQKLKLLEKYSELIEADLLFAEGNKDEMMEKLRTKLGKTEFELAQIIERL